MDKDFGPYELRDRIGKGGMAWVYLANQKNLDRLVALKILFPHLAEDEKLVARFQLEARSAAQMRHENVCQVYDFGRHGDQFYIAMEYVEGLNLREWIDAKGTPPLEIALLMLRDICRGLEHAHRRSIIHRDIKPSNVMFTPDGVIKLMDFGLARRAEDTTGITMVGSMLGTPAYMSPEQARGEKLDRATTDIFSFGIVCYELLSGSRPFQGDTSSIARAIMYAEPRPLDALDPLVPPVVEAMIRSMLEKDAAKRAQTVTEVRHAFDESIAALAIPHERGLLGEYAADPEKVGGTLRAKRLARHLEDAGKAEERGDDVALLREYRCVAFLDPSNKAAANYVREHGVPWPGSVSDDDLERTVIMPPDPDTVLIAPGGTSRTGTPAPPAPSAAPPPPASAPVPPSAPAASPLPPPVPPPVPPRPPAAKPASAAKVKPARAPERSAAARGPAPPRAPAKSTTAGPPLVLWIGGAGAALAVVALLVWQPWKSRVVEPAFTPVAPVIQTEPDGVPLDSVAPSPALFAVLNVVTTPADAKVSLDGGEFVPAPARFADLDPREYTVRIRRDSFQVARRVVPLAAGRETTLTIALRPVVAGAKKLALLIVQTVPPDALVQLDGERTLPAPARFRDLSEGEHTLEVRREGYETSRRPLVARAGAETTLVVSLTPERKSNLAARSVTVRTSPRGSQVSLDGGSPRKEPAKFEGVTPGLHRLRVTRSGAPAVEETFALAGSRDTTITLRLDAAPVEGPTATLVLWSRPPADYFVERVPKGHGDSVRVTVAANRDQDVTIKEASPWFGLTARLTVRPKPGEVKYVGRDFTADGGRLEVDTPGHPGAEVLLDGKRTGRFTPATLFVTEGAHKVHVVAEGKRTKEGEQSLRFKAGQGRVQTFTLEPQ